MSSGANREVASSTGQLRETQEQKRRQLYVLSLASRESGGSLAVTTKAKQKQEVVPSSTLPGATQEQEAAPLTATSRVSREQEVVPSTAASGANRSQVVPPTVTSSASGEQEMVQGNAMS